MTRSDIFLEKARANTTEKKDELINHLHQKIENVYSILFEMEKVVNLAPLSKALRNVLESN